jgi:hypothetical protein
MKTVKSRVDEAMAAITIYSVEQARELHESPYDKPLFARPHTRYVLQAGAPTAEKPAKLPRTA